MSDQPNDQPSTTLTAEGLRALYADLGEKTHLIYELRAQLEQVRASAQRLLIGHAPGECTPVAVSGEDEGAGEPTPMATRRKGG